MQVDRPIHPIHQAVAIQPARDQLSASHQFAIGGARTVWTVLGRHWIDAKVMDKTVNIAVGVHANLPWSKFMLCTNI